MRPGRFSEEMLTNGFFACITFLEAAPRAPGQDPRLLFCSPCGIMLAFGETASEPNRNLSPDTMPPHFRQAMDCDTQAILDVARSAFGSRQGDEIATLIDNLLGDPTAHPLLSVVATNNEVIVGHVLFTRVSLERCPETVSASILAPLAVHPDFQNRGIGGMLIAEGLKRLRQMGVDLVFVLGDPGYYRKHGFSPAGVEGYAPPYPIAPEHADAWMAQELRPGIIGRTNGRVTCAQTLSDPKHWQE